MAGCLMISKREPDPLWLVIVVTLLLACALLATGHGAEPAGRIAFVGSRNCPPCKLSERDTITELRRRGFEVIEYDGDRDDVKRLFGVKSVPAWFALDEMPTLQRHGSADEVLDALCLRPQPRASPTNATTITLAELIGRYVGSRACLELALPAARDITLDGNTTLHLPKLSRADVEITDNVVVITFEKPVPTASTIKLGATLAADLPLITIKQNTITATADVGLGIKKRLVYELKETPWD